MSNNPGYGSAQPARSNGLGTAGFVISLVGLFISCGVLCPIGLILSLVGLRKQPRGLAIAGSIIGFLGSLVPVAFIMIYGIAAISMCSCVTFLGGAIAKEAKTQTVINQAEMKILDYQRAASRLPSNVDGNGLIDSLTDGYDHHLRYTRVARDEFELRSAGADGAWNTADDKVAVFTSTGATLPASVRPPTEP